MADECFDSELHVMNPCALCGKWMPLRKESQRVYCCEECSQNYDTCRVCGGFFLRNTGVEEGLCSQDCGETREKYFSVFKELDE